ncbi:MAG: hypothetical protein AAF202_03795, partial [Pseudomonadota bacterium]
MGYRLKGLLIAVIAVTSLVACNEGDIGGAGKSEDEPKKNTLHLKGYRIDREKQSDGAGGFESKIYDINPFDGNPDWFLLSDQISTLQTKEGLTFHSKVLCGEGQDAKKFEFEKISAIPFDRKIEFLEIVPEGFLYRPGDAWSDALSCQFWIHIENRAGSTYSHSQTPDERRGEQSEPRLHQVFASDGNRMVESLILSFEGNEINLTSAYDTVPKGKLSDAMIWTQRLQYQDREFSKVRLQCETYSLDHELSARSKQMPLSSLNFDQAVMKEDFKHTR